MIGAYAAALAAVIPRHEPWTDEAQAWLLARDSSVLELITTRERYEGSPPLWHLILMPAAKLHLPYMTINIIAGVISFAGVCILVRRAPFPPLVRLLLPFSFFILYQYGVVARSYCLLAPLLFLLAILFPRKLEHPWRWCLLLALLANVSVHGLLIAGSLQLLHLVDVARAWHRLTPAVRRLQVATTALLGAVAALVVYELRPPSDLSTGAATNLSPRQFVSTTLTLVHAIGISAVAVAVLAVTAWWLWRTRCLLLYGVPTLALLLLFSIKYANVWHEGVIFLVWVFALWVSFERGAGSRRGGSRPLLAMSGAMAVALLIQVGWSVNSVRYDWSNNYSGSRAMAEYIRSHGLDHRRIAALYFGSIAVLPYFDRDIFIDVNDGRGPSYYLWSTVHLTVPNDPKAVVALQPDYIMVAVKSYSAEKPCLGGYSRVYSVSGDLYWKTRRLEPEAYALYVRTPGATGDCPAISPSARSRFA